ncbi:MAG TPA: ABC transporter ATP-binding protein [Candidatus Paceibacterota bacterium]
MTENQESKEEKKEEEVAEEAKPAQEQEKTKVGKKELKESFSVLLQYLRKYRKETIALSIFGIISAVGNGIVPYVAGRFFDSIITPEVVTFFGALMPLYVALLIVWAIVQLVTYLVDWQINIKSENFSNAVWVDYWGRGIAHLLMLPMAFHKAKKIGEVGEKINRAAFSLETIIGRIVIDLAPQFLSIVIALVIGFYIKPILAVALLAGILIYSIVLFRSVAPIAEIQREYQTHLWRAFGDSFDLIGNAHAIKQATAEEYEANRMSTLLKGPVLNLWGKMNKIWSNLTLIQRVIILATQLFIFVASVYFISRGAMTLGELLAFNAYAAMMFGPFVVLGRNWQTIQNGVIQLEEAEAVLREVPENYHPSGAPVSFNLKGTIKFDNVYFHYEEKKPVLENISFNVTAGEIVALVGESGVGKSTLVELISGYQFPIQGQVRIDGEPIEKIDLISLRQQIGIVPQEVVLFNDTILHNIRYGNFSATDEAVKNAARSAHAYDFIEKFPEKWQQIVGERGVKLSVGQKQRVAIARAILRNPKILILDEPTSALDAGSEKIITESLEKLMRGKTTFIIAHRLSTVRKADKILVFKDGRLIEQGKHDELLKIPGGEYRRLYELQIGLHG